MIRDRQIIPINLRLENYISEHDGSGRADEVCDTLNIAKPLDEGANGSDRRIVVGHDDESQQVMEQLRISQFTFCIVSVFKLRSSAM